LFVDEPLREISTGRVEKDTNNDDSISGAFLPDVLVELFDTSTETVVGTTVTDIDGVAIASQ
jgi:hypothetical protein